jgi:hydroxypyruvate isomerase
MKRSACIETLFTELPFADRFRAAKDAGFDYVEFWGWTDKNLDAIRSASEKAAIPIGSMSGDMSFSLVDPTHKNDYIEFIRKSIQASRKIRCDTLVIHSNALGEGGKVANHYSDVSQTVKLCSMFDTLRDIAPIAEQAGITLVLEALNTTVDHVGNFLQTTRMGAEMTRIIGSKNLKILYDIYHMQMNEGSLCDTLSAFIDQIGYIHAADTPGRHEPGTGEIHYPHVLAHLERIGYTGIVGYELFPKGSTADAVRAIIL